MRVLIHNLNYKYLKTNVKNPLLKTNNYQFMLLLFLKITPRSLKIGLKLLFIDETRMKIDNNNYYYYRWKLNNQLVFGETYKDTKT